MNKAYPSIKGLEAEWPENRVHITREEWLKRKAAAKATASVDEIGKEFNRQARVLLSELNAKEQN